MEMRHLANRLSIKWLLKTLPCHSVTTTVILLLKNQWTTFQFFLLVDGYVMPNVHDSINQSYICAAIFLFLVCFPFQNFIRYSQLEYWFILKSFFSCKFRNSIATLQPVWNFQWWWKRWHSGIELHGIWWAYERFLGDVTSSQCCNFSKCDYAYASTHDSSCFGTYYFPLTRLSSMYFDIVD